MSLNKRQCIYNYNNINISNAVIHQIKNNTKYKMFFVCEWDHRVVFHWRQMEAPSGPNDSLLLVYGVLSQVIFSVVNFNRLIELK